MYGHISVKFQNTNSENIIKNIIIMLMVDSMHWQWIYAWKPSLMYIYKVTRHQNFTFCTVS